MTIEDKIIRLQLEERNIPQTDQRLSVERERVSRLNKMSLDDFLNLSRDDRELAEEVWTARVIQANLKRQQERRQRIESVLSD